MKRSSAATAPAEPRKRGKSAGVPQIIVTLPTDRVLSREERALQGKYAALRTSRSSLSLQTTICSGGTAASNKSRMASTALGDAAAIAQAARWLQSAASHTCDEPATAQLARAAVRSHPPCPQCAAIGNY